MKKASEFLNSTFGKEIFSILEKSSIYKPQTQTTVDVDELGVALKIVPKIILKWLSSELKPMAINEHKEIQLSFMGGSGNMHVTKLSNDVYSGELYSQDNKRVYDFKYRSLPSIGLVLMSTFELYDFDEVQHASPVEKPEDHSKEKEINDIIDERLKLHALIRDVVDQRISQKDALQQLVFLKIKNSLNEEKEEEIVPDKKSKLRDFLENKNKGEAISAENIDKSEDIKCYYCNGKIYKSGDSFIKCCICLGDSRNQEIPFTKKEGKIQFKLPKGFDKENLELLLDTIKKR